MEKRAMLSNLSPAMKLVVLGLVVLVSLIFVFILGMLVAIPFWGSTVMGNLEQIANPTSPSMVNLSKYLQVVSQLGLFIVPAILFSYLVNRKVLQYLKLNVKISFLTFAATVSIMFLGVPFINWLLVTNSHMQLPEFMSGIEQWMKNSEEDAALITEKFLNVSTYGGLAFNIFMIAIIPALGEEFLFRGILQRLLQEWTKNPHIAIFIAGFVFSFIHLQFYGFLPRMFLGVLFGYLFYWSRSIWIPVIAHFVNNAMAVIAYFFYKKGMIDNDVTEVGEDVSFFPSALISIAILSLLMVFIYNTEKRRRLKSVINT